MKSLLQTKAPLTLEVKDGEKKKKKQPMTCLEIERTKKCHFTSKIPVQWMKRGKNDMDNTFVLGGSEKAHF